MTFELVDLEELGEKALEDFNHALEHPGPGSTVVFEDAVNSLVTKMQFTYAVAAKLAHREPTVEGTAAIWAKIVSIGDEIAHQIKQIEHDFPGSKASFDRVLDLRNAAERRRELHS